MGSPPPSWIPPGYAFPNQETKPFLETPLACDPPPTWEGREKRVEWCLRNLTPGEKAYLYRLLYEGEGLRIDGIRDRVRKEKQSL